MKRKGNYYKKLYRKLHREKLKVKKIQNAFKHPTYLTKDSKDEIAKMINAFSKINHSLCEANDSLCVLAYSFQWLKESIKQNR